MSLVLWILVSALVLGLLLAFRPTRILIGAESAHDNMCPPVIIVEPTPPAPPEPTPEPGSSSVTYEV